MVPNTHVWEHASALLAAAGAAAEAGVGAVPDPLGGSPLLPGGRDENVTVVTVLHTPAQARFVDLLLRPLPPHTAAVQLDAKSRNQCFNLQARPRRQACAPGLSLYAPPRG